MFSIKQSIKQALRKLGVEVCSTAHYAELVQAQTPRKHHFFQAWQRHQPQPQWVIDVGANHGNWTRTALSYFPNSNYLLIEPQERLRTFSADLIARPNVKWLTVGLSDQPGRLKLTLTSNDASASFTLTEDQAREAGCPQTDIHVTTLDDLVVQHGVFPEIVKIDAEGLDMNVLLGASRLIGKTDVFFVEAAVCSTEYPNSLEVICQFMWSHGYQVMDVTDLNDSPRHNVLWLIELVFVKTTHPIWSTFDRQV